MSNLKEAIEKTSDAFKKLGDEAEVTLKHLKRQAKKQRRKMRKRGIRLVQDYCN